MRKLFTYTIFTVATALVVLLFVTSKNYTQLTVAVLLYPAIAYLALNLFPRKEEEVTFSLPHISQENNKTSILTDIPAAAIPTPNSDVADNDKRTFLKFVGVAGVSVFLLSLFNKRSNIPFLGKLGGSDAVAVTNKEGKQIDPAERQPLDGYQISEMADGVIAYYGFINKEGSWFIMREDTQSNSFRYAKGESSFPKGWLNRENLKYDYYYNV